MPSPAAYEGVDERLASGVEGFSSETDAVGATASRLPRWRRGAAASLVLCAAAALLAAAARPRPASQSLAAAAPEGAVVLSSEAQGKQEEGAEKGQEGEGDAVLQGLDGLDGIGDAVHQQGLDGLDGIGDAVHQEIDGLIKDIKGTGKNIMRDIGEALANWLDSIQFDFTGFNFTGFDFTGFNFTCPEIQFNDTDANTTDCNPDAAWLCFMCLSDYESSPPCGVLEELTTCFNDTGCCENYEEDAELMAMIAAIKGNLTAEGCEESELTDQCTNLTGAEPLASTTDAPPGDRSGAGPRSAAALGAGALFLLGLARL